MSVADPLPGWVQFAAVRYVAELLVAKASGIAETMPLSERAAVKRPADFLVTTWFRLTYPKLPVCQPMHRS
jgi:hypothetical protein